MPFNSRLVFFIMLMTSGITSFHCIADDSHINFERLHQISEKYAGLRIIASQAQYQVGDVVGIEIAIHEAGWLNILEVGPDDKTTILFPNAYSKGDNSVPKGIFRIGRLCEQNTVPGCFSFTATEPRGRSIVVAVWTRNRLNLWEEVPRKISTRSVLMELEPQAGKRLIETMSYFFEQDSDHSGSRSIQVEPHKLNSAAKLMGRLYVDIL